MRVIVLICFFLLITEGQGKCTGRFINPVSDICWSCLFPITICGLKVSPGNEDTSNPRELICKCGSPIPRIGIPISFWEPARLIDVTRVKFCLVNMGGLQIGPDNIRGHGNISTGVTTGNIKNSFYQVHYYVYPVLHWLELLTDFVCMEHGQMDIAYITEFDPLWNDDETAFVLNPEAVIFGNPIAQAACAADSVAATTGFPLDAMFWCAGCQGSIYPHTGHVPYHIGGVQASLLLVSRMLAKMHKELLAKGTAGKAGMCGQYIMPVMVKSQYKQQMLYPVSTTGKGGCRPLGRTSIPWEGGKEKPYVGEDFGYLIWRKRIRVFVLIMTFPVYAENFQQSSVEDKNYAKAKQQNLKLEQFHSLARELEFMIGNLPKEGKGCKNCGGKISYIQKQREFNDGILVFVSFSMPKTTLIELNRNAEKYNAKLVIRGVYKNSFREMKDKILNINREGLKMDVDPQLFKQYGVKRVPTFVLIRDGKEVNRLAGNVSLEFAYKRLMGDK